MFTIILIVVALVAGFAAGALESSRIDAWIKTWSAARALKAAKAVVDAEVARVTALENARAKIVASKTAPAVAATGPTGS